MESAYFSSRMATTMAVRDAAQYLARHSATEIGTAVSRHTAPVLVRLLHQIASRFEIVVTEKLAAQAVPIAGAALGSLINAAFADHFNRVAEYHFRIVRLERATWRRGGAGRLSPRGRSAEVGRFGPAGERLTVAFARSKTAASSGSISVQQPSALTGTIARKAGNR